MQDLNDLYFFAQIVAHGGFAPAGRHLNQPKSKLSRRVAQLEARLGVRLIERSSRRFRITEIGQAFYERCRSMGTRPPASSISCSRRDMGCRPRFEPSAIIS
jgi:DNA-binding transcriptional LysR family regulator